MKIDIQEVLYLIAEKGMIYKEMCLRAGISEGEFRKIRSGERNPKPSTIGKIAKALDVSVHEIIIQEGDQNDMGR